MNHKQTYRLVEHLLFPRTRINSSKLEKTVRHKTILITGATFGIGEQVTKLLAEYEVKLVLVARTYEKLNQLKVALKHPKNEIVTYQVNLYEEQEVVFLIEEFKKNKIEIDILISNAGKSIKRSVWESLDRYHDVTRTATINYLNPCQLVLALLPDLCIKKGKIINISALNVQLPPVPGWSAYQASKVAFDQWLKSIQPELEEKGIAVHRLYLPLVRTRMIAPTKSYDKVPAMSAQHVAKIIVKKIYTGQKNFQPWWLFFVKLMVVLFPKTWVKTSLKWLNKDK